MLNTVAFPVIFCRSTRWLLGRIIITEQICVCSHLNTVSDKMRPLALDWWRDEKEVFGISPTILHTWQKHFQWIDFINVLSFYIKKDYDHWRNYNFNAEHCRFCILLCGVVVEEQAERHVCLINDTHTHYSLIHIKWKSSAKSQLSCIGGMWHVATKQPHFLPFPDWLNTSHSNFKQMGMPAVCSVVTASVKPSSFNKWARLASTLPYPASADF